MPPMSSFDKNPAAAQALLRRMFDAAIASAQPALCIPPHLPDPQSIGNGRLIVIGAGKASAAMARAVDGLQLFGVGYSWGGYESLFLPAPPGGVGRSLGAPEGSLIRLHAGLEDPEELKHDLWAALARLEA